MLWKYMLAIMYYFSTYSLRSKLKSEDNDVEMWSTLEGALVQTVLFSLFLMFKFFF